MILQPTNNAKERILCYGHAGSGKTYAWQRILANTPDDVTFWVVDTDNTWLAAQKTDEMATHAHRVRHFEPEDWPDYRDAVKKIREEAAPSDWLVIDMADTAWEAVQRYYEERVNKVTGDDLDEWLLDSVDDGEDTAKKFGTINKLYYPWATRAYVRPPCNVFVCSSAKDFRKNKQGGYFQERKQTIQMMGSTDLKAGGQWRLPHDVDTVLLFSKSGSGQRTIQMVKDRYREERWGDDEVRENDGFERAFLLKIAKWRPVKP